MPTVNTCCVHGMQPGARSDPALPVHTLIERQVRLTPEAVALTFGEEWLTYRELDAVPIASRVICVREAFAAACWSALPSNAARRWSLPSSRS